MKGKELSLCEKYDYQESYLESIIYSNFKKFKCIDIETIEKMAIKHNIPMKTVKKYGKFEIEMTCRKTIPKLAICKKCGEEIKFELGFGTWYSVFNKNKEKLILHDFSCVVEDFKYKFDFEIDDEMFKLLETITKNPHENKIYFVYGDENISENLLSYLLTAVGDKLQFIPESLIKENGLTFPLHNIEHAKYLVVTGVKRYDDIDKGFLKMLSGGDPQYDNISHRIVKPGPMKIIIFCDNDPNEYFASLHDVGFICRMSVIENGILI